MSLIRAFTTLSLWTMISRIFGFMRDVLFANILGAGRNRCVFHCV